MTPVDTNDQTVDRRHTLRLLLAALLGLALPAGAASAAEDPPADPAPPFYLLGLIHVHNPVAPDGVEERSFVLWNLEDRVGISHGERLFDRDTYRPLPPDFSPAVARSLVAAILGK
jgi:hypothetical protein